VSESYDVEPLRYDAMCLAIAEYHRVDEVKEIRDRAVAFQAYAKQALEVCLAFQSRTGSLYTLGRQPDDIFPLRFRVDRTLATGDTTGEVEGFYQSLGDRAKIER
jgi:hypothetical protein